MAENQPARGKGRRLNPALLAPVNLAPELEAIVGKGPMTRRTVIENLWDYIHANSLQDDIDKRSIRADKKLSKIFDGKHTVNMFELVKLAGSRIATASPDTETRYDQISFDQFSWNLSWEGQTARITFSTTNHECLNNTKNHELTAVNAYLRESSLKFSSQIRTLEDLISSRETSEHDLQVFFEECPDFLLGLEYVRLYPQVILEPHGGKLIPDFFLEPLTSDFCDIVELKRPIEPLVVGRKNRRRFAAAVYDGVAQLREYSRFFDSDHNKNSVLNRFGIKAYRPKLTLIIGRAQDDQGQLILQRIRDEMPVDVVTYDELVSISKNLLRQRLLFV